MAITIRDPDEVIEAMATEVVELSSQLPAKIENDGQFAQASELWRAFKEKEKEYESAFEAKKKPVRELLNTLQAELKGKIKPLIEAMDNLKPLLTQYQTKKEQLAQIAQRKEQEKYEKKVEKAIEKGKDVEAIAPPQTIQAPPKTLETGVGFIIVFKWRLKKFPAINSDLAKKPDIYRNQPEGEGFPDEFWLLDLGKVTKAVKANVGVPAPVERYETKGLASR